MRLSAVAAHVALGTVAVCATLSLGCKGSTDAGDGGSQTGSFYIRFKANGSQVSYSPQTGVFASFAQVGTQFSFNTAAAADNGSSINLGILDASAIKTATYTGFQPVGTSGGFRTAQILYNVGGVQYSNDDPSSTNTIAITEITTTTVRGTFRGTVKAQGRPSFSITDGEFLSKRIN